MDIEFLIQRLERYILEECPKFFSTRLVNEDEARSLLTQLRGAVPDEVREAQEIVEQRDAVLEMARQEATRITNTAKSEAQKRASEHQIAQEARHQAGVILRKAEREALVLRNDADEYVFDSLSRLQGELTRSLRVVENGLQRLESDREKTLQSREQADGG